MSQVFKYLVFEAPNSGYTFRSETRSFENSNDVAIQQ